MSKDIECSVENDEGEERIIIIVDYTYSPGYSGKVSGPPEDCYPGEAPMADDIEATWKDSGAELTDEEFIRYKDIITETIYEYENEIVGES